MDPSRWRQIEELYHAALECEPRERAALLERTDPELRREVESLLAQQSAATLLDHPAWEGTASLLESTVAVLTAGTRLGPYKIEGPLGAGGMGQVFRASDTRLGRSVAIKTSHEQFSVRFDREARAISSLNHPHICTLYDVGPNYLVMELCEGETLAARLKRGKLSVDDTLRFGAQIADALAAAHAKGIVHRDLKPGNIILTKIGVKVLDFGLAKSPQDATLTGSHMVLGTPAYMGPEQREGKECDARSDIYSLGLVLYEMAVGERKPHGQPPATETFPPRLAHVIERCLAEDPENRWQTARDVKLELQWAAKEDVRAIPEKVPRRALFPWLSGAVALAGGSGLAAWVWRGKSAPTSGREIRFQLAPPENTWLRRSFTSQSLALSPIGGRVAMIAHGERSMIWVKNLDSLTASPLQGTDGASMVFWSPDAEFIGFWAGGKLKKIAAEGGTPLPICDLPPVCSATWSQDGAIVASQALGASFDISAKSGAVSPGKPRQWPKFLPGGKYLLYLNMDINLGGLRAYAADASTGHETALMPTDTLVTFTPDQPGSSEGHLIFGRGSTLLALRFDMDGLRTSGEPAPVAKDVPFFTGLGWSEFDTSPDGVLIHSTGSQEAQLTWLDRSGRDAGPVGEPKDFFGFVRFSPDGRRFLADVFDFGTGGTDIWAYELPQATAERVTFEPFAGSPVWSPDGKRIAYMGVASNLKLKNLSDHGKGESFPPTGFQLPSDWSSDGRWILYQTNGGEANAEIWLASTESHKLRPLLQTQFDSAFPVLSPDQKHLAFSANHSGRSEIYVQRFSGGDSPKLSGEPRRVSRDGGNGPRWRRDGREIFFLSADHQIMAASVKPETEIEFGQPTALFQLPTSFRSLAPVTVGYEVSADGRKFLVPIRKSAGSPLQVVVNWQAGLKK